MAKQRYTAAEVITAIERARGIKAVAAKILGCSRVTVDSYAKRYVTVAQACQQARETLIDVAEGQLVKAVDGGEWPAVRYVLATLGKERGYSERQEITGAKGKPLVKERALTDAELEEAMGAFYRRVSVEARSRPEDGD